MIDNDQIIIQEAIRLVEEGVSVTLPVKGNSMLPFIIGGKESVEKVYNDYCSRRKVRGINALKNKEINLITL